MTNANINIDFLVIGAQKCATTWLYECIRNHPQICVPKHKKEIEYLGGELYKKNGIDWYLSLLEHCTPDKIKGDVSVEYIINEESPEILYNLNPKMKFILSVRNPTERAISALKWYLRKGLITNDQDDVKQNIAKAIQSFSFRDKDSRINNRFHDVLYRGLYAALLANYFKFFERSQFLIIHYEDIQKNSELELKKIFSFLDVNKNFIPPNVGSKPKKNSNSKLLIQLESKFPKNKMVAFVSNKIHQVLPAKKSVFEKEIIPLLDNFYTMHKEL